VVDFDLTVCKSIVFEIETQLNNTQVERLADWQFVAVLDTLTWWWCYELLVLQNDHDMDVVFRISEEKKQIKYSRSEVGADCTGFIVLSRLTSNHSINVGDRLAFSRC
jgi:hypothetical protein